MLHTEVGLSKHLGDVATVLLDLVSVCSVSSCDSRQTDDDQIRSLCGALAVSDSLCKISLDYYN